VRIRDGVVRAVVLVVTVSLTLVLLPIAINVGTGGTAPGSPNDLAAKVDRRIAEGAARR
jgi:hypothetical protein